MEKSESEEEGLILNTCVSCKRVLPNGYTFLACYDCAEKINYDYQQDNFNYESKNKK